VVHAIGEQRANLLKSRCGVLLCGEMRGKDGEIHGITVDASSLYDAADKATRSWSMFSWFSPTEPVTVQRGQQRWKASQERVRKWREARKLIKA
jgi:hypothetical protein